MTEPEQPFLRVVRGDATPEEIAALVAVLAAASASASPAPPPPRSSWADSSRGLRRTLPHGPGAWRASGLPR